MSLTKRRMVLLDPKEDSQYGNLARQDGLSVNEWIRQALKQAARPQSQEVAQALARMAKRHLPAPSIEDLDTMAMPPVAAIAPRMKPRRGRK